MSQHVQAATPSEMISPFAMPPPQYTTMPQDLSTQLARTQVLRRLSTKSSNTSNSSRRNSARVTKLGSEGSSPHHVQRRRTTAAHTARDHSRISQDNSCWTREQRLWHYYNSRNDMLETRPFSWHSGLALPQTSQVPMLVNDNAVGNAIAGLENLAVTNTPPSVQQSIQNAFSMGYGYPISTPSADFTPQLSDPQPFYPPMTSTSQKSAFALPAHDDAEPSFDPYGQTYQFNDYSVAPWAQNTDQNVLFAESSYTTPVSSASFQQTADTLQYFHTKELPETPKAEGEELVGIGLYDREDRGFVSTLNSTSTKIPGRSPPGKELKLQETWHPPSNEEDDEESSEELEEAEELPTDTSTATEAQLALYPTYGDLSDQSFFINDDADLYPGDDQYANYLALDNGLQVMEQGKPPSAGTGDFLWF